MVARRHHVVAHFVHDVDDVAALGERADGVALNGIARVHQRNVTVVSQQLHLQRGDACVSDCAVHRAVYVVGIQNREVFVQCGFGSWFWRCSYFCDNGFFCLGFTRKRESEQDHQ